MGTTTEGQSVRVFMSYRRADSPHFVGRLHDRLCAEFGDLNVFRDIDSIRPGEEFAKVIIDTLDDVDVVVGVIGHQWARQAASVDERDYVHMELAEALRRNKPLIPVLVDGTPLPRRSELPAELAGLLDHNVAAISDASFRRDASRLVEGIRFAAEAGRLRALESARAREVERQAELVRLEAEEDAASEELLRLEAETASRRLSETKARVAQRSHERMAAEREAAEAVRQRERLESMVQPQTSPDPARTVWSPPPPAAPNASTPNASTPNVALQTKPTNRMVEPLLLVPLIALVLMLVVLVGDDSAGTSLGQIDNGWFRVRLVVLATTPAWHLVVARRTATSVSVLIGASVASISFAGFLNSSLFFSDSVSEPPRWYVEVILAGVVLVWTSVAATRAHLLDGSQQSVGTGRRVVLGLLTVPVFAMSISMGQHVLNGSSTTMLAVLAPVFAVGCMAVTAERWTKLSGMIVCICGVVHSVSWWALLTVSDRENSTNNRDYFQGLTVGWALLGVVFAVVYRSSKRRAEHTM